MRQTPLIASPTFLACAPAAAAALLALLVRLWFLHGFMDSPLMGPLDGGHDRALYHAAAKAVAGGRWWPSGGFAYLPLYPWALGLVYIFTGPNLHAAAFLGLACDTLSVALLVCLARRLGAGPVWAGLAGALYALYPRAIVYATLTMPTTLNVLLVTALAYGLAGLSARSPARWAALGLLAGVAGLGFPAVWPAVGLIALLGLLKRWPARWPQPRSALIFLFAALLPVLPVALHNSRAEGRLTLLSTHGGFNFFMGNHERATGYPLRVRDFRLTATAMLEDAHHAAELEAGRPLSRSEGSAWWSAQARRFMTEHPGQAAALLLRKVRLFWSGTEVDDLRMVEQIRLIDGQFTSPAWTCFALFSFAGLFGLLRVRGFGAVKLLVWCGVLGIASAFITTRYRLPLTPALAAFGAAGIGQLAGGGWFQLKDLRAVAPLLIAVALAAWPGGVRDLRATDHYNASVQLLSAGSPADALAQARAGIALDAQSADLFHAEGSALFKMGDFSAAARSFTQALALRPSHGNARFNLALSLGRAGDPCAALSALEAGPATDPRSTELARHLRALCHP